MPVTISREDFANFFDETEHHKSFNQNDRFDVTWQYSDLFWQGINREIELRSGIELAIEHCRLNDDLIIECPERPNWLEYAFGIAGKSLIDSITAGQYMLCGNGIAPVERWEISGRSPIVKVTVHIDPEVFLSFLGDCELGSMGLEHLIKYSDRYYYKCHGTTTAAMQTVLHQMLHCSFAGMTKKIYLESKVWELMALLLEEERERHQDKPATFALKSDDIDRIHHAKDILTQQSERPPSLLDLARQVGLNDCTLKRGFKEVFGTTAFGYLHEYRLEQARLLLLENQLSVAAIANGVGYKDVSAFGRAFRKKFGVRPRSLNKQ